MSSIDLNQVNQILRLKPQESRYLLEVLQEIQAKFRYLPKEALLLVADHFKLSVSRIFSVACFYKALSLVPKGERMLTVCQGTACHLRGASQLVDSLEKRLGLKIGETAADGSLSLESVNCLGACALAPVATVDGAVHGHLTPDKAQELI
ncbi:MAG: NAD(P)H-dependent oxidoreductase subunit E [Deltaproteobacteria bacterium]|jgi:NADH-quinone oxidoreductase subunit E|nr:NAD(P)H-dependent oxidoreductase subunit E [Deltaproteobacteria bacterium]